MSKSVKEAARDYARSDDCWVDDSYSAHEQTFEAGAAWQRERDIGICKEIELRGFVDKVPQSGAIAARLKIEQTSDDTKVCAAPSTRDGRVAPVESRLPAGGNPVSIESTQDWYHELTPEESKKAFKASLSFFEESKDADDRCVKCRGFKAGGSPYGHSCTCTQNSQDADGGCFLHPRALNPECEGCKDAEAHRAQAAQARTQNNYVGHGHTGPCPANCTCVAARKPVYHGSHGLVEATASFWNKHGGTYKQFVEAWNHVALRLEKIEQSQDEGNENGQ